jgi:hypothetical protein
MHSRAKNKPHGKSNQLTSLFQLKNIVLKKKLAYSRNLERAYMECDYTHFNHNSLVSQKVVTEGVIIKGVYYI